MCKKKITYYLHVTISSVQTKVTADVTLRVHHPLDYDVFRQFVRLNLTSNDSPKVFIDDASCFFRYEDYTPSLVTRWPPSLSCILSTQETEKVEYARLEWSGMCNREEEKVITMAYGTVVTLTLYLEDAGHVETSSSSSSSWGNLCTKVPEPTFTIPVAAKDTKAEENFVKEIWQRESRNFERKLAETQRKIKKRDICLQNLSTEVSTFWSLVWSKQQEIESFAEDLHSEVPRGCELSAELEDWEAPLPDAAQLRTQSERLRLEGTCLRTLRAVREELEALGEGNRLAKALVDRYGEQLARLRSTISTRSPVRCQKELLKLVEARDNILSLGKFSLGGSLLRHLNHSIQTTIIAAFDDRNQFCDGDGPNIANK